MSDKNGVLQRPRKLSAAAVRHQVRQAAKGWCSRCHATIARKKLVGGAASGHIQVFGSTCLDEKSCRKRISERAPKVTDADLAYRDSIIRNINFLDRRAEEAEAEADQTVNLLLAADLRLRAADLWLRSAENCRRFHRNYSPPTKREHYLRCASSRADRGRSAARRASADFDAAAKTAAPESLRILPGGKERSEGPAPRLLLLLHPVLPAPGRGT